MSQENQDTAQEKKETPLELFMRKYAPEATEGSYELVARDELLRSGYQAGSIDFKNLTSEQEKILLTLFTQLSKESMRQLIFGIVSRDYFRQETERLRQEVEAARARREAEARREQKQ